jgi:hypothetical protein
MIICAAKTPGGPKSSILFALWINFVARDLALIQNSCIMIICAAKTPGGPKKPRNLHFFDSFDKFLARGLALIQNSCIMIICAAKTPGGCKSSILLALWINFEARGLALIQNSCIMIIWAAKTPGGPSNRSDRPDQYPQFKIHNSKFKIVQGGPKIQNLPFLLFSTNSRNFAK